MSQRKLAPKALKMLDESKENRIAFIKQDRWIGYPVANRVLSKMEEFYNAPPRIRVKNILVVGDPNAGKSTLKERFLDKYPAYDAKDGSKTICPLLHIQAPSEADPTAFLIAILHKLGEDIPNRPFFGALAVQVQEVLEETRVKVIVVDEFHNFLKGRSDMKTKLLNEIRGLNNTLKISFFFFGTRDALKVVAAEPQLSSRCEREFMPRWDKAENAELLVKMLKSLEMALPLLKPSNLHKKPIRNKIAKMSEGILGEIVEILEKAAIHAIESGDEKITSATLDAIDYLSPTERLEFECET